MSPIAGWQSFRAFQVQTKQRILEDLLQGKGLLVLFMRPRNGQDWKREDREMLVEHFRVLQTFSPYALGLLIAGAPLTLRLLSWWLDRRRFARHGGGTPASS